MYKQINKYNFDGSIAGLENAIIRLSDNAVIPFDPDNTDYQDFLKYQAEGGQVLPADTPEGATE